MSALYFVIVLTVFLSQLFCEDKLGYSWGEAKGVIHQKELRAHKPEKQEYQ